MRPSLSWLTIVRSRAGVGGLAAALLLTLGGAAYAAFPDPRPTSSPVPEFTSTVVVLHSEMCLAAASQPGTVVFQRDCDGQEHQRFEFVPVAGDFYQLRNPATGGCLDIRQGLGNDGAPLILWADCHGKRHQQFSLLATNGMVDTYQFVARHSGKCLDVEAGSQVDRAQVVQWECGDPAIAGNQLWRIDRDGAEEPTRPEVELDPSPGPSSAAFGRTPEQETNPPPSAARPASTNPEWGRSLPPDGAPLSRAYQMILGDDPRGYHPKPGECSREIHARYWIWGPDGKVYPTWHPPRDPSGCTFGHEHGDDPRDSVLFDRVGWPAFGYVNEQLAPSSPASQRDEDHVGHKIQVGNGRRVIEGDDGTAREVPDGRVSMICDSLIKFHQGTHGADAFTNNLHEFNYNVRCEYTDDGSVIETRFNVLPPIGPPGGFTPTRDCGGDEHRHVGTATPSDSPDNRFQGRRIPDEQCAARVLAGEQQMHAMHETWFANVFHHSRRGSDAPGLRNLQILGYFLTLDPSRYFDPSLPGNMGRQIDLCYEGAPGFQCDQVRRQTQRTGERIEWDDPRSPFRGAHRLFAPGIFIVQNEGPTTLYTDPYGLRFSTEPFPGSIKQYISGNRASDRNQGFIRGTFTNYAADAADGVRAPN